MSIVFWGQAAAQIPHPLQEAEMFSARYPLPCTRQPNGA